MESEKRPHLKSNLHLIICCATTVLQFFMESLMLKVPSCTLTSLVAIHRMNSRHPVVCFTTEHSLGEYSVAKEALIIRVVVAYNCKTEVHRLLERFKRQEGKNMRSTPISRIVSELNFRSICKKLDVIVPSPNTPSKSFGVLIIINFNIERAPGGRSEKIQTQLNPKHLIRDRRNCDRVSKFDINVANADCDRFETSKGQTFVFLALGMNQFFRS
mmetsp:Transcript_26296/g.61620  ORF Transcript_26296/g.61620 Transcript_26296/m.61620 type:complete len:215 (-) Transcript_26296:529-1173(-)